MAKQPSITHTLVSRMVNKARRSDCTYKVSAVAFDKKGDVLGTMSNSHASWDVVKKEKSEGRPGTAKHAERLLLARYGENVKTIVICRVGHSGELRPIDPCPACAKTAAKLGVKIISVS